MLGGEIARMKKKTNLLDGRHCYISQMEKMRQTIRDLLCIQRNKKITTMSNICKAFEMSDINEQKEHFSKLEIVERFGDECNGKDLYKHHEGCRILKRCPVCDALVLCQYSILHYNQDDDEYYTDYFSVGSREEAVELNEKYDGYEIEREYKGKKILF